MSDMSKESREEALERILAETAKNPYVPKKPIRPARPTVPKKSEKNSSESGNGRGIPVTRVLTEAQKAEAAKERAAKKVEEIKRIRQQREAEEKRRIEAVRQQYFEEAVREEPVREEPVTEEPESDQENYQEIENTAVSEPVSDVKIRKAPKKSKRTKRSKKSDDSGLWDTNTDLDEKNEPNAAEEIIVDKNIPVSGGIAGMLESIITVVLVVLMIYTYLIRGAAVDGTSMCPTLNDNDILIVRMAGYTPKNGDVVIINNENSHLISDEGKVVEAPGLKKDIVKRIIASGGQTVDIDFENSVVKVDGKTLDEKYISEPTKRDEYAFTYPLTIPDGYVFVMGDNRNVSMDSRHPDIGLVPEKNIVGKVIFRAYPFDKFGGIE